MNISRDGFISSVDPKFWQHIRRKTLYPTDEHVDKEEFLSSLHKKIISGKYFPSTPREHVIEEKEAGVPRIVPVFELEDYCVYFFCIKQIEEYIAKNRVGGTFGGYSLGGRMRQAEEAEYQHLEVPASAPARAYNQFGWRKAWSDFQSKAYSYAVSKDADSFLFFDIANFYDSIDLNLLEARIRHEVSSDHKDVINLLFLFLRGWNRKSQNFQPVSHGIPQDEIGDCSRILANYYLQDYDNWFTNYCNERGLCYLRYADDQVLMSHSPLENKFALYEAALQLKKIYLNLNASKVLEFSEEGFVRYWAFEIFQLLDSPENTDAVVRGIELYFSWFAENQGSDFRWHSVFRLILDRTDLVPRPDLRSNVLAQALNPQFLTKAYSWHFEKLLELTPTKTERVNLKNHMLKYLDSTPFNKYPLELRSFARNHDFFSPEEMKMINNRIKVLAV